MPKFISLTKKEFELVHKANNNFLTVTNFICFIGHGYKSRRNLFRESPTNKYAELAMAHGNKYEPKCLQALRIHFYKDYMIWTYNNKLSIFDEENSLLGTCDGYCMDLKTGEMGIVEIKCPYGTNYGRHETSPETFEFKDGNHKHWMQLQLYLLLHRFCYNVNFGLLVYYYTGAGPNGETVMNVNKIKKYNEIDKLLEIKKWMNLLKTSFSMDKKYNKQRIPELSNIISTTVVHRQQVLL